jgi:hypothetical protein
MANNIDWTSNLTTHPSYGAIPPGGVGYEANSIPNVTISTSAISGGYTIGNGGTGHVWTTNTTGAGTYRINDPAAVLSAGGRMELKGDGADLTINGKSLKNWMEKVEERLNILTPNSELEQEWDELRRLGERYRKLEKKCKEKAEVWNKLKSMPKPEKKW